MKYSVPKRIPIAFHNESNYNYHFIIKELAEEFKKQFTCLGENTEKYITFTVRMDKEITRINKNGEKITKSISYISHSLLLVQNLWQAHYQILSIIFLKEFIELNANVGTMKKQVKSVELNIRIASVFSNIQTLKMI